MDKTKNTTTPSAKNDPLYVAGYHKRKVLAERILGSALLLIAASTHRTYCGCRACDLFWQGDL